MKRLSHAAMLGVMGIGVAGPLAAPKENVLFEEQFTGTLGARWSWIREDPRAWKIDNGALVLHTLPGYLYAGYNDAKNVLLHPLPETKHPLAIEVNVQGQPKVQFEHAGVVWYVDDDNFVGLFQEVVNGKITLVMVVEKAGKARTTVVEDGAPSLWLRLLISAGTITGQFRSSPEGPWHDVDRGELPAGVAAKAGISAGGAPKDADRHVRFKAFRILELISE